MLGARRGLAAPPDATALAAAHACSAPGILWFGWFGFNAGSALGANGVAAQAFINTFVAAAAAMLGVAGRRAGAKAATPTTLGAASGAVAGLVAITPCAGFVGAMPSIAIGAAAGIVCYLAINLKFKFGYDDSLDVVAVHLVGGSLGSLLLGLFADASVNPAGTDGVFYGGGWSLFGEQVDRGGRRRAVLRDRVARHRDGRSRSCCRRASAPTEEEEEQGLDLTQHSETGYALERV